jgi:energy-coupling factor transporter ATP-binding protein EcfA2
LRIIVGLTGPAGAGKSTAAFHLETLGYHRIRFAGPLKAMAASIGLTPRHIEGDLKEVPCDLICGKTPRYFMQKLGTEFGRDMIGDSIWIDLWKNQVNSLPEGAPVVVDDCRFPNEEEYLRVMGGEIIRVVRKVDTSTATFTHESEKHTIKADYEIINDGTINQLHEKVRSIVATF